MQKANLPEGAIMQAAARDGVELPSTFFGGAAPVSATPATPKPAIVEAPKHKYDIKKRKDLRLCTKPGDQLRGIFWNVLPGERVETSMWTSMADEPPINLKSEFSILERDFAKVACKTVVKKACSEAKLDKGAERPPLLDAQRQQNLGIGLARFKESAKELKSHIVKLNQDFFTMEVTHKLLSMVPTTEEIQLVENARAEWHGQGPFESGLSKVDEFVVEMSSIPRLRQRLQCLFVDMTFERQTETLLESMEAYLAALRLLKTSPEWKKVLHLVLSAGNYLNSGNKFTGGAWGFEVSTGLQKLSQSKSTANSKFTLLHWVAQVIESKCPELFKLSDKLKALELCSNIKVEDLKADFAQLCKGCELVEREIKACKLAVASGKTDRASGSAEFLKAFTPFLEEHGQPVIEQLKSRLGGLEKLSIELLTMHGELPSKCSSTQLMITATMFSNSLLTAREEVHAMMEKAEPVKAEKSSLAHKIAAKVAMKKDPKVPHIQSA